MELFHHAKIVRLRSHLHRYLTANEDEEGSVTQHRNGFSKCARWTVEYIENDDKAIRLKSCHGKYLTASDKLFVLGNDALRVCQTLAPRVHPSVEWKPVSRNNIHVALLTRCGRVLRANIGHSLWRNSVTHSNPFLYDPEDGFHWEVDVVEMVGDDAATPPPEQLNTHPLAPQEQLCRPFSLTEILSATHDFDESLVIGQGGFGKVYRGVIEDGATIVALKRLNSASKQGDSEFRTEIEMLSKFRHSHIVSLIGYYSNSCEKILVYENMVNGSLADHLYKIGKYGSGSTLSWLQRLKICLGAARGLDYLHTGTGVQDSVIHRDVKSSNILLDKNWAAKVSDFGLSRICPIDQSCTHISTNVKGTMGYMDPEYLLTLKLTMKSDVYSFGVVLFEALCGRRAVDLKLDEEQWSLARWAQHCIEKGTLHQIIDPNLKWEILPDSLTEFARIANQCLCYRSKKRPTMTQVVASLEFALALQLGNKDSCTSEMDIFCTSEAYDSLEKVDSTILVQQEAIKVGNCDEDNNEDILQPRVKLITRKSFPKMLQSYMFCTVKETSEGNTANSPNELI